ncbi:MAG: CpaF family protein [Lachnospiraceae bacterium]|nr:CpaF family protein [Lachnospiraceae bacterium]
MKSQEELKADIYAEVRERLDLSREMEDGELWDLIYRIIAEKSEEQYMSIRQRETLAGEIFASLRKLDILQELLDDDEITEIMVNGPEDIFIEKRGILQKTDKKFQSAEKLEDVIQQIVASCNRTVNESSPIVDGRISDGSRVNVVLKPPALNGPIVTIRRFPETAITMEDYIAFGSITPQAAVFLQKAVEYGYNIFISGGTGSGKTTLLNILSGYIPSGQRIITIEDSAELQIKGVKNLVRLETRNATREGCEAISIRDLIKTSLRMRPDRIIVGEVRGAEAFDMLQVFNTGHEGSLSTAHANSASDMLMRLEMMVLMAKDLPLSAIRRQIASGIDLLIHLGRMRDGSRKVMEILEIKGIIGEEIALNPLFVLEEGEKGKTSLVPVNSLQNKEKWIEG